MQGGHSKRVPAPAPSAAAKSASDNQLEVELAAAKRQAEEAEARAHAEARDAADLAKIVQPGWGFAAKAAALKSIARKRVDAARSLDAAISEDEARMQINDACISWVLTDVDFLYTFMALRAELYLGARTSQEPIADEAFHEFASCAAVCTMWRDAIAPLVAGRRVLQHGRQLPRLSARLVDEGGLRGE